MNDPHRPITRRRLVAAGLVAAAAALAGGSVASAGGWAIASLDAVPSPRAGDTVTVGFDVLQHGVTPVHPDGDVGVDLVGPGGATYVRAVPDGDAGHYTARVTFPEEGSYTWSLRLGWFGPQDLGSIDVGGAAGPASDGVVSLGNGLLAAGGAAGATALVLAVRDRRRAVGVRTGGHGVAAPS